MKSSSKKAFTFIEMLGVLCIVVILISISTIAFRHGQEKARDMVRKNDLQMIADALISYANDHGHFPSSIYDNVSDGIGKTPGQVRTIVEALKSLDEGCNYFVDGNNVEGEPDKETITTIVGNATSEKYKDYITIIENAGGSSNAGEEGYSEKHTDWDALKNAAKKSNDSTITTLAGVANICENNTVKVSNTVSNANFAIVTQGMCASNLKKYLVDNGYISQIPQDPSLGSIQLETNICIEPGNENKKIDITKGVNANDTGWSLNGLECYADTNLGCTQICKAGYVYISDGEHFALIARMESKNNGNYEVTSCGSCELANQCKSTPGKTGWTSTEQLPCDITDEFTNTFDCIQNTGIVEYSTGQYYFYIY